LPDAPITQAYSPRDEPKLGIQEEITLQQEVGVSMVDEQVSIESIPNTSISIGT
jgi:hypothetical protein